MQQYGELVGLLWAECYMLNIAPARVQCRDHLCAVMQQAPEPPGRIDEIGPPFFGDDGFSPTLIATEPHLVDGLFLLEVATASLP